MEATKRGKKKKPRSFEWLLKLIDGIYNARIEYCSKRTSGNMIDSCVQPFPAFVLSYLMEKDSNNKLVARAIENLVFCVNFFCNTHEAAEGEDFSHTGKKWIVIFSQFIDGKLPTSAADFFIFAISLVKDCHYGVRYPILEDFGIPYWISSIAAFHILDRMFPCLDEKGKRLMKSQIKAMQSRASVKEVAVALGVTENNSYADFRLPYIAFLDVMLDAFCRDTTSRLDRIHNDFNKITSSKCRYISFSDCRKLLVSVDPLIALNMQLESFFMEESAKINSLDPSVSKENFGSLCKIDFVGLHHVLERIGAFTLQLGYIIEPPRQTYGDKSGADAFEAMSRLNGRCMKIFNRLIEEIETMNSPKDRLGMENESFSLNSTLAILRFRQHCVACEWQAKISPYRLEFAMMRLIHSLHEVTFLHQGFKGELAFSFSKPHAISKLN